MREQDLLNQIRKYLTSQGFEVFRANSGFVKTPEGKFFRGLPKGFPDLFAIDNYGNTYFFEVKTPIGILAPHQKDFIARLRNKGFKAGVVTCIEEVDEVIQGKIGNREKFGD